MARHKRTEKPADVASGKPVSPIWQQPSDAKFINVSINDADKEWLQAELDDHLAIINELFTEAGKHAARISVVPDIKSGRYNATFTAYASDSPRYGLILSVRGATPIMALYCLAYANGYKVDAWKPQNNSPTSLFG